MLVSTPSRLSTATSAKQGDLQANPARPVSPGQQAALRIERLADASRDAWDAYVSRAPGGTVFHTVAWRDAVSSVFGHRAHYLAAWRACQIVGVFPLFEVRSLLGGRMLVSVPYGVYGGPLADDAAIRIELIDAAAELARDLGVRCVELRCERAVWPGVPVIDRYVTFRRALPEAPEDCLSALPRKARAAARMARERHHLQVCFDDAHLEQVWRMYCASMRRLGSINYPYSFFAELVRRMPDGHFVSLVTYRDTPVVGLVTFIHNDTAMPYFVGADPRYHHVQVNNFVYLTAMERAVALGCGTFDFGRSRRDNVGVRSFKRNHGFAEHRLEYQTFAPPGVDAPQLTPSNPRFALARRVWPHMPSAMTRPLGAWLAKHIPG